MNEERTILVAHKYGFTFLMAKDPARSNNPYGPSYILATGRMFYSIAGLGCSEKEWEEWKQNEKKYRQSFLSRLFGGTV